MSFVDISRRSGAAALLVLATTSTAAHAQTVPTATPVEVAVLDAPGFTLQSKPASSNEPVGPSADLTPPATKASDPGLSPELARQMRWRKVRGLELTFQALNVIDAAQTISCLSRNVCSEINPLYGRNPSTARVIGMKAAGGALHYLITRELVRQDVSYLRSWQFASIAIQGGAVAWNMQVMF